ncbi:MAG: triose-phosphate isomerase [Anaplasmataceae bacterium]|nr:triose-phosphate isomerase [Anaplasmataceae bacterium]
MKKLLIANWKMNPQTLKEANKLLSAITIKPTPSSVELVVCPPAPYLSILKILRRVTLGAQNVHWKDKGAHTGEYSPSILKSVGVKYVIIGHSERRHELKETDDIINQKVRCALADELKVVLCVGEDLNIRKKGFLASTYAVKNQLLKDLSGTEKIRNASRNLVIAYEPVWAISTSGSGRKEMPADAVKMINYIGQIVSDKFFGAKVKVIYGGSVSAKNISAFMKQKEIDGALVGGASLKASEFKKMIDLTAKAIDHQG